MGRPLYTNNAATYLAFGITNTATTMQVSANAGGLFPNPVGGDYFYVSLISLSGPIIEIVKCTARNGDIFTIERGQEGTSPLYWNTGDNVQLRITAAGMNFISGASATTTEEETQTATQGQTLFTLNTIDYTPNTNNLAVFVNGSKQVAGLNYSETAINTVTFLTGLNAGDVVEFILGLTIATGTLYATDIRYNEQSTGAVTRTLESKLQESVSVLDFGAKGDGTTNDSVAVQNALNSGYSSIYFPSGTYLVQNVSISHSVTIYGDGFSSIIKSIPSVVGSNYYSTNIFTSVTGLSDIVIKYLVFDGSGTTVVGTDPDIEQALVLLQQITRIEFDNVKVTGYSANAKTPPTDIYSQHFQAITIRNLNNSEYIKFNNVLLTNNFYELVSIYNGPTSVCETIITNSGEINTVTTPTSHTAFEITGGKLTFTDNFFYNTGPQSTVNINATSSSLVSNNQFIKQVGGSSAVGPSINYGQAGLYGQSNCIITNNYFNNTGAGCILHSGGNGIIISDNICIDGGLEPIKVLCALDPTMYAALLPAYTVPTLGNSYSLHITNNQVVGAQYTSGPTSRGIWIGYLSPSVSNLWYDVLVENNTVSMDTSPNDLNYCLFLSGIADIKIKSNYFNYKYTAIYSYDYAYNVEIVNNEFAGAITTQSDDVDFIGGIANTKLVFNNNRFVAIPLAQNYNIQIISGTTFGSIEAVNNINTKPGYFINTTSLYFQQQLIGQRLTSVPTTGIWRAYDTVYSIPASGVSRPMGWVCTTIGSFAGPYTATASGVVGNYYLTVTDGTQFKVGERINVTGVGSGGASQKFTICQIVGNQLNTAEVVNTTASAQTVTPSNPVFVTMPNYA